MAENHPTRTGPAILTAICALVLGISSVRASKWPGTRSLSAGC